MRSLIRIIFGLCAALCTLIFSLILFGNAKIPDNLITVEDEVYETPEIFGISVFNSETENEVGVVMGTARASQKKTEIKLLNIIPVKDAKITNTKREYVIPGGEVFGIKFYTDGIIVVGTDAIKTENGNENPAESAGLLIGDIIKSVDGVKVTEISDLKKHLEKSNGENLVFEIERNSNPLKVNFRCVKEKLSGKYKAGLWVRDSTAGLGTVTFYSCENKAFGGLGHAVCDVDTEEIMPMSQGEMVEAYVNGIYKSSKGNIGELCGVLTGKVIGELNTNCETGVYGITNSGISKFEKLPVAVRSEVKEGDVQIICSVDKSGPRYYNAKIVKIYSNSPSVNKDMIIEITDNVLLEKTGGILQGMSGSPIIQNGMLVGAVTHVFVNNPKQGYAIFAEKMIETSESQKSDLSSEQMAS